VILSPEEVGRLIAVAPNLKHQAAMSVAYGARLRVSEVVSLKVNDIDSQCMTLRVEQGKVCKDRYAMLSAVLLERLRFLSATPRHVAHGISPIEPGWKADRLPMRARSGHQLRLPTAWRFG
jgi:integrase